MPEQNELHDDTWIVQVDNDFYGPFADEAHARNFAGNCDSKCILNILPLHDNGEFRRTDGRI